MGICYKFLGRLLTKIELSYFETASSLLLEEKLFSATQCLYNGLEPIDIDIQQQFPLKNNVYFQQVKN